MKKSNLKDAGSHQDEYGSRTPDSKTLMRKKKGDEGRLYLLRSGGSESPNFNLMRRGTIQSVRLPTSVSGDYILGVSRDSNAEEGVDHTSHDPFILSFSKSDDQPVRGNLFLDLAITSEKIFGKANAPSIQRINGLLNGYI